MSEPRQYRRSAIAELTPWTPKTDMSGVSVSEADQEAGSPKPGDMIARNPKNHADKWPVAAAYFADNFEPLVTPQQEPEGDGWEQAAARAYMEVMGFPKGEDLHPEHPVWPMLRAIVRAIRARVQPRRVSREEVEAMADDLEQQGYTQGLDIIRDIANRFGIEITPEEGGDDGD